jgi:hypothetical protein
MLYSFSWELFFAVQCCFSSFRSPLHVEFEIEFLPEEIVSLNSNICRGSGAAAYKFYLFHSHPPKLLSQDIKGPLFTLLKCLERIYILWCSF